MTGTRPPRARKSRRLVRAAAATAIAVVAALLVPVASAPAAEMPDLTGQPPSTTPPRVMGLEVTDAEAVAEELVGGETGALGPAFRPPARTPHVVIFSTGVDATALPAAFADQVTLVNDPNGAVDDPVGYGTWAASVVLQYAPDARISSVSLYPSGWLDWTWVQSGLKWLYDYQPDATHPPVDAVLFAFPPHDYLDPLTLGLDPQGKGLDPWGWAHVDQDDVYDAVLDHPWTTPDGANLGRATWSELAGQYTAASPRDKALSDHWRRVVNAWRASRWYAGQLAARGTPVVVPAGDLGRTGAGATRLQSIFGLANLPEVVTVGAADGPPTARAVVPSSGTGPGMDGSVKPDLLAPTGAVGLLPGTARLLPALPGLDRVTDAWAGYADSAFRTPEATRRGRVNSTVTSAALVAAGLAALHESGVTDPRRLRGALLAAATPIPGVPVWRQGAGVLERMPTVADATGPVVGGAASLGAPPATGGAWQAQVPVLGDAPLPSRPALTAYAGLGAAGQTVTTDVDPAAAPPVSASVEGEQVVVRAVSGSPALAGSYCGWTPVTLPAVNRTEELPTCLVQGLKFAAEARYIHNEPAENTTYVLTPALPPTVAHLLDKPLEFLPVDPLHVPLYAAPARKGGCDPYYAGDGWASGYPRGLDFTFEFGRPACALFEAIVPGYYQTRLFSDYGTPARQTDSGGSHDIELGARTGYQKLPMWVLPRALDLSPRVPPCAPAAEPCAEGQGTSVTRDGRTYTYDKTTDTYTLGPDPDAGLRFAYGHVKRIVGANVSGRVVDLLDYDGYDYGALHVADATGVAQLRDLPVSGNLSAWQFRPGENSRDELLAVFNPLHTLAGKVPLGVARYPVNLPTPNYLMHISVNFHYRLTDAVIVVAVDVGNDFAWAVVTPQGATVLDPGAPLDKVTLSTPMGTAEGDANLEFGLKPKGSPAGTVTLYYLPTRVETTSGSTPWTASSALLSQMSLEYDTWTNAEWPQVRYCRFGPRPATPDAPCPAGPPGEPTDVQLHTFTVAPRWTARQVVANRCRDVASTRPAHARVCEDWEVLVHSPLHDARVHDVLAGGADPFAGATDVTSQARALGARRNDPDDAVLPLLVRPLFEPAASLAAFRLAQPFNGAVSNEFWETLALPLPFVSAYPDGVTFRIENNAAAGPDDAVGPRDGANRREVAPYVCFVNRSSTTGGSVF